MSTNNTCYLNPEVDNRSLPSIFEMNQQHSKFNATSVISSQLIYYRRIASSIYIVCAHRIYTRVPNPRRIPLHFSVAFYPLLLSQSCSIELDLNSRALSSLRPPSSLPTLGVCLFSEAFLSLSPCACSYRYALPFLLPYLPLSCSVFFASISISARRGCIRR